jgi:hypothetical protein
MKKVVAALVTFLAVVDRHADCEPGSGLDGRHDR